MSKIPAGQRITPYLSVRNAAKAIEFYRRAFGAVETMRLEDPSGRVSHAELELDGAKWMLADEHPEMAFVGPEALGGTTVTLSIYVEDVDALAARAIAAGAKSLKPITDEFYGERVAQLADPFGHRWSFQSRLEEISTEEMQRRYAKLIGG